MGYMNGYMDGWISGKTEQIRKEKMIDRLDGSKEGRKGEKEGRRKEGRDFECLTPTLPALDLAHWHIRLPPALLPCLCTLPKPLCC